MNEKRPYRFTETGFTCATFSTAISFRFSAKYTEVESGLLNYGRRYLQPPTGRWLSRDPIYEDGDVNIYGFCLNDSIQNFDPSGQVSLSYSATLFSWGSFIGHPTLGLGRGRLLSMQDDGSWASNREIANAIHKWPQEIANNLCDGKAALVGIRRSKEHEIKIADNPIESFLMNWVTLQADWDCKPVSCGYSCKFKWKIVDTLDLEIAKQKSSSYTADIALAWTAEIIGTHYYDPRNGVGIWKRWWTRRPALNGFEAFDWEVQMKDTQERLWCDYSRALRQK